MGLFHRVVPDGAALTEARALAARLAEGPTFALGMTKTMLNNSLMVSMDQALEDEGRCQTVNFGTEDTTEAMMAFVEKRDPKFQGR